MEKSGKIISSLIIGASIIVSVVIFSFKKDIAILLKGPDIVTVRNTLNIPVIGFTESLKESFDIVMEQWGENVQYSNFISFRNKFLKDEAKILIPFIINESIVWLPTENKEEILNDQVNFIACKVFIYKDDTLFVPEKRVKEFQEAVPRAKPFM